MSRLVAGLYYWLNLLLVLLPPSKNSGFLSFYFNLNVFLSDGILYADCLSCFDKVYYLYSNVFLISPTFALSIILFFRGLFIDAEIFI